MPKAIAVNFNQTNRYMFQPIAESAIGPALETLLETGALLVTQENGVTQYLGTAEMAGAHLVIAEAEEPGGTGPG